MVQVEPVKPAAQLQEKMLVILSEPEPETEPEPEPDIGETSSRLMQVPPFAHESDWQIPILIAQVGPVEPGGQSQEKPPIRSVQVPPFSHGFDSQSS